MVLLSGCTHSHVWQDATCTEPARCTGCDATEGDAPGHELSAATYQSPAICSVCGAAVGDPIAGVFEERGYKLMSLGQEYDCVVAGNRNRSLSFPGLVTAENYRIVPSFASHEAKDGFEWRIVDLRFALSNPIIEQYGYFYTTKVMDYYLGFQNTGIVNLDGVDYQCAVKREAVQSNHISLDTIEEVYEFAVQVPTGYDGMVVCIYNPAASLYATGTDVETLEALEQASPLFFRFA